MNIFRIFSMILMLFLKSSVTTTKEINNTSWQSTGKLMFKQAESYFQLRLIKDSAYIDNFKMRELNLGRYAVLKGDFISYDGTWWYEWNNDLALEIDSKLLDIKNIKEFTIDDMGSVILQFETDNSFCATVNSLESSITKEEYLSLTLVPNVNLKCAAKNKFINK